MKIALHGKDFSPEVRSFIEKIFSSLAHHNCELYISNKFEKILKRKKMSLPYKGTFVSLANKPEIDFVISLGGDGTLLDTVTYVGDTEKPILGINIGRLGFLATVTEDAFAEALEEVLNHPLNLETRTLISFESNSSSLLTNKNYGLNEFSILKRDSSSMITVHAYLDGEFLNSYWADGLIISTPTGSTGYSLSCGGPIIMPQSKNFVITPINPHNLTVRSVIVPDEAEIQLKIESRAKHVLLALDSRSFRVDSSIQVTVKKEKFSVRLIKTKKNSFFDSLREKLNWGLDARN